MGRIQIITGMSGAGKTVALKSLEDMGFYCVDNLPIALIRQFVELLREGRTQEQQIALGIDVRSGRELPLLKEILDEWDIKGQPEYQIIFLDANDESLLKRYKETRRSHPLSKDGRIETGIAAERSDLAWLKRQADSIIDTSRLLTRELRQQLERLIGEDSHYHNLQVSILSFGFKYGIPEDADLLFDVRFLPNPYYMQELRPLTGQQEAIQRYVMQGGKAALFLQKLEDMLRFLLPEYVSEGKNQLVIAVGCTGGKHRSVTVAELLYERFRAERGYGFKLEHRDLKR